MVFVFVLRFAVQTQSVVCSLQQHWLLVAMLLHRRRHKKYGTTFTLKLEMVRYKMFVVSGHGE